LDAVHVSFVHRWGRLGPFGAAVTDAMPRLEYVETESGIRQIATRGENNVRVSDWTFPNNNHIVVPGIHADDPWTDTIPWIVPIDDEHCLRIQANVSPVQGAAAERVKESLLAHGYKPTGTPGEFFGASNYDPSEHHEAL